MNLKLKKYNHIFKNILIGGIAIITLCIGVFTSLDGEVLKKIGVDGAKAVTILISDRKTFTISSQNDLYLTAPGVFDASTSSLTSTKRDPNSKNQVFSWVNERDNYGYLLLNGTSKAVAYDGKSFRIEEYRKSSYQGFTVKAGISNNIIHITTCPGFCSIGSISFNGLGAKVSEESFDQNKYNQSLRIQYTPNTPLEIIDNGEKLLIPERKTFTISSFNDLFLTAPGVFDASTSSLTSTKRDPNSKNQVFSWVNERDNYGYLLLNGTSKAVAYDGKSFRIEEYRKSSYQGFTVKAGYSPNSFHITTCPGFCSTGSISFNGLGANVSEESYDQEKYNQRLKINFTSNIPLDIVEIKNKILIPDNKTFTISSQNNLYLTAPGVFDASTSSLTSTKRDPNSKNQVFSWVNERDNYGYLLLNGTSKAVAYDGKSFRIEEYRKSSYQGFTVKAGYSPNSFHITTCPGFCSTGSISFNGLGANVSEESYDQEKYNQRLYLKELTNGNNIKTNVDREILKTKTNFTMGTKFLFNFKADQVDNSKLLISNKNQNNNQIFTWVNLGDNYGNIFLNNSNKVLSNRYSELEKRNILQVEKYNSNSNEQRFKIKEGFAVGTYHIIQNDKSLTIKNSTAPNTNGNEGSLSDYNQEDFDQILFFNFGKNSSLDNNKPIDISKPPIVVNPPTNTNTTGLINNPTRPLIPNGYIFTMTNKSDWGIDANNYKTQTRPAAYAYPRAPTDVEQVIKWVPAENANTGYLVLNGTDLAFMHVNGRLELKKWDKSEGQKFYVRENKDGGSYFVIDKKSNKAISIPNTKGQDVTLQGINTASKNQMLVVKQINRVQPK